MGPISKYLAVTASLLSLTEAWGPFDQVGNWGRPSCSSVSPQVTVSSQTTTCGYAGGPATATIDAGILHGTTTSLPAATATVNKFLGIPFAKNPPLRFGPPEKNEPFSTALNVSSFGPSCLQQFASQFHSPMG